jgi:hypothetical protein
MSVYARVAAAAGRITLTAVAAATLSGLGGVALAQAATTGQGQAAGGPGRMEATRPLDIPNPATGIGSPIPCLNGYVWRQAFPQDYVCVSPATRDQAADDDDAATSRVELLGGAYGPYTCDQGYVWRGIVPTDYVCVLPATRSQAAYDDSQAGNRYLKMQLWITNWTPPAQGQNCNGNVCTTTDGVDGPNIQINGDLFNYGKVQLYLYHSNNKLAGTWTATAGSYTGYPGGAFGYRTPFFNCAALTPGAHRDDYVIAHDLTSGRWSQKLPVNISCATL